MPDHSQCGATIRAAVRSDAAALAEIYNHYVNHTIVTFEEDPVSTDEFTHRISEVWTESFPWLVAEDAGQVVGYAYASKWKSRCAYRYSAEVTVYLAHNHMGRGIGTALYAQLFPLLQAKGIHAVIGGVSLPNEASVALHEKFGMKKVAHFLEVGFKLDRWIDVGYWQRTF